jgi:uncharacterized protein
MTPTVYFGSAHQARLDAKETLPAKLEIILDRLHLRERVKGELVVLKMHVGNNMIYSTIHPIFVRRVVQAIKDGGGKPFIADVDWDVEGAETRAYTTETVGCPIYPAGGLKDSHFVVKEKVYKNLKEWKVAGLINDATFLVNFAHVKGHPSCGFGGAMKNLALGCMVGETRGAIHDAHHYDRYWFAEKCPDPKVLNKIIKSCPFGAIVKDKKTEGELHIHFEQCNQCMRCLKVAPPGSLKIERVNFESFQEAAANSVSVVLSTFEKKKAVHIDLVTHQSPVCDCFGFTSLPILPDVGIFGSDDIIAVDTAVLDATAKMKLIEENLPTSLEVHTREGHPYQQLHGPFKDPYHVLRCGESLGLGSMKYKLEDVMPVENISPAALGYIKAQS